MEDMLYMEYVNRGKKNSNIFWLYTNWTKSDLDFLQKMGVEIDKGHNASHWRI